MPLYRAFLQTLGAIALLAMTLACGGKGKGNSASDTTAFVTGNITYSRVPLAVDANGVPTGLMDASVATNLKSFPARGAVVRAYQLVDQTTPEGKVVQVWTVARTGTTDSSGNYSISVAKGRSTMVEVLSSFDGGNSTLINVVAEPGGINSTTGALDRLRYALRKAADGTAPVNNNAPNSVINGDSVVNFTVGLNDAWWLVNPAFNLSSTLAPWTDQAVLETTQPGRTAGPGSGSRILAIGDSIASFVANYGSATPGTTLDLHYWPGRSEPGGSYIDYGPYGPQHFPQAYDTSTGRYHFFGSLQGGNTNDDAWDEGVILPMLGRNYLYTSNLGRTFSVTLNPLLPVSSALPNLSPDMARIEGLAEAMAANVLKSPYLADTQGTSLVSPVRDIRDISSLDASQKTPFSAPALRAFSWELILKANSLPTPGVATDWANINPLTAARFFLIPSSLTKPATDTTSARDIEPINIYSQLVRFREGKSTSEPVDLNAVLTDAVLAKLGAPFGITWPRPTTGTFASFAADWGADPSSSFPTIFLGMSKATQVNGLYPNLSQGEVFYTGFSINADKRCTLSVAITPALGSGTQIEVDLPAISRTFSFAGTGGTTESLVIPVLNGAPYYHPVRIRLKSPSSVQPDVAVTLTLVPAP